jgi:2-keto-4-pentenoate hydratase/2-oxohepta-3-ene-1,7-dioic acid hydratase in catechol pathway
MRIVHLGNENWGSWGVLGDSQEVRVLPAGAELGGLTTLDPTSLCGDGIALADLTLVAPITPNARIVCVGLNFAHHAKEANLPIPEHPALFARFASSLVGAGEPIVLPNLSSAFDFEGELAVVIGRAGRHVARESALEHVLGYTCFADNSLRDWQSHSRQVTAGKNFDRSGAIGPWIVTRDEIPDLDAVEIETFVNGERRQHGVCGDFIFSVPEIVAYVSDFMELKPGDVLATGTPAGCAALEKAPRWLRAGDLLEVRISGIGSLINQVTAESGS